MSQFYTTHTAEIEITLLVPRSEDWVINAARSFDCEATFGSDETGMTRGEIVIAGPALSVNQFIAHYITDIASFVRLDERGEPVTKA